MPAVLWEAMEGAQIEEKDTFEAIVPAALTDGGAPQAARLRSVHQSAFSFGRIFRFRVEEIKWAASPPNFDRDVLELEATGPYSIATLASDDATYVLVFLYSALPAQVMGQGSPHRCDEDDQTCRLKSRRRAGRMMRRLSAAKEAFAAGARRTSQLPFKLKGHARLAFAAADCGKKPLVCASLGVSFPQTAEDGRTHEVRLHRYGEKPLRYWEEASAEGMRSSGSSAPPSPAISETGIYTYMKEVARRHKSDSNDLFTAGEIVGHEARGGDKGVLM
jgi:hypothetical protein